MLQQNVLTIATGKPLYLRLAENMARSFYYWNKDANIKFYLATDQAHLISEDVKSYVNIIPISKGEFGTGFSTKLHLDHIAPKGKTLFIDSDCLIYGNIQWIFDAFNGHPVSVVGNYISDGEWFGDIKQVCKSFKLEKLPKFNGGIYYLESGDISSRTYQTARDLEKKYDEIGFLRLRNTPNDEVLMAVAIALHNLPIVYDDGSMMSDPQACQGKYHLDIIKGTTKMINPPYPSPLHQNWYPHHIVRPKIIHFLGSYAEGSTYLLEAYRVKKALAQKSIFLHTIYGNLTIKYPDLIKTLLKNMLRPLYRLVFGKRKIKSSPRMN